MLIFAWFCRCWRLVMSLEMSIDAGHAWTPPHAPIILQIAPKNSTRLAPLTCNHTGRVWAVLLQMDLFMRIWRQAALVVACSLVRRLADCDSA